MADYDFTIRATDNLGAYSDRTFTIGVRNTNVERFVALTQNGIFHSATAAVGSWKQELNVVGRALAYGDGQWVAYGTANPQTNTNNTRTYISSDGVNWAANDIAVDLGNYALGRTAFALSEIQSIKYVKGAWTMFALYRYTINPGTYHAVIELTSTDLKSWAYAGRAIGFEIETANFPLHDGVYDFDYNPTTDQWVAVSSFYNASNAATRIYRRTGNALWSSPAFAVNSTSSSDIIRPNTVSVTNLNGQWAVNLGGAETIGVAISTNGTDWVRKQLSTSSYSSTNLIYSNGYLIRCSRQIPSASSTTTSGRCIRSTNGGRDWSNAGSSGWFDSSAGNTVYGTGATAYGNICIVAAGISSRIAVSRDSGASWTEVGLSGAGTVYSVMARPD